MIKAVFEKNMESAQAGGAYQYDTGQKIYLYGLPETMSGTIEMQFAYAGDTKTEGRVASWDAKEKAWAANIPNKYLQRSRAVNAYLYVTVDENTAQTMYTAVFTPKARPATGDEVTPDEQSAWGELVGEITLKMAEMDEAISRANAAAVTVTERLGQLSTKETQWEARIQDAEQSAQEAEAAASAASASASAAAQSAAAASSTAQSANTAAQNAVQTAQSANAAAASAQTQAQSASETAGTALSTANAANVKATGAHYWQMGPMTINAGTSGWISDSANDRYYQDFAQSGVTAGMLPYATCEKIGGAFPLCGVKAIDGKIRLYMADVPTVTDVVTVYILGVRT